MAESSLARMAGAVFAAALLGGCGTFVDRMLNQVYEDPPYQVGPEALALHERQVVVDLHGDILLWNRDLLERASYGHVDLPRLQEGNVALQVYGVVTQVPLFVGLDNNSDRPDLITALAWSDDWPPETSESRLERALYQADKLQDRVRQSAGALRLITARRELDALIADRGRGDSVIGAILSLEGTHALEGDPENIDRL